VDPAWRLWHGSKGAAAVPPLTGHSDYVLAAAFSPDGRLLGSGGADGRVCVWVTAGAYTRSHLSSN
jgi:WD40 repeat protein